MPELLLPLTGDAGPNDYVPTPVVAHYLNVDELVSDDDTSYLSASASSEREAFSFDTSVIGDSDVITSVIIRTTWNPGANYGSWKAGFIIGGIDYFGAVHDDSGGDPYRTTDDTWTTNPATGLAWTKTALAMATLIHQQVAFTAGLPRPRLTQCVPIANVLTPIDRPTADNAAVVPGGSVAGHNIHGSVAAPRGPTATGQALVPTAPPSSPNQRSAAAAATVPYGTAAAVLPSATPRELP